MRIVPSSLVHVRALISERTKAALAAAKRSGRKLGTAGNVETAACASAARSEQTTKANAAAAG